MLRSSKTVRRLFAAAISIGIVCLVGCMIWRASRDRVRNSALHDHSGPSPDGCETHTNDPLATTEPATLPIAEDLQALAKELESLLKELRDASVNSSGSFRDRLLAAKPYEDRLMQVVRRSPPESIVRLILEHPDPAFRRDIFSPFNRIPPDVSHFRILLAMSRDNFIKAESISQLCRSKDVGSAQLILDRCIEAAADEWVVQMGLRGLDTLSRPHLERLAVSVLTGPSARTLQQNAATVFCRSCNADGLLWIGQLWQSRVPARQDPSRTTSQDLDLPMRFEFLLNAFAKGRVSELEIAAPAFLDGLPDLGRQSAFIYALRESAPEFAVRFLIGILRSGRELGLRKAAAVALSRVRSPEAVEEVLKICAEPCGRDITEYFLDAGLNAMDARKLPLDLLRRLFEIDLSPEARILLSRKLSARGGGELTANEVATVLQIARSAMADPSGFNDWYSAEILSSLAPFHPDGVDELLKLAGEFEDDPVARERVLDGLVECRRDPRAFATMASLIRQSNADDARVCALRYLARHGSSEELQTFVPAVAQILSVTELTTDAIDALQEEKRGVISAWIKQVIAFGVSNEVEKQLSDILSPAESDE